MSQINDKESLVILIDRLAPINNKFRVAQDPIMKIETMWDFGMVVDSYLKEKKLKLHELLYQIYDPYSRVKMSYITRDLGSYCYRVFNYFSDRNDIESQLKGLSSYTAFREAIPLLFNPRYGLTDEQKRDVIRIITARKPVTTIIEEIREKKKRILPISNPRNQKANDFSAEREYLLQLRDKINSIYTLHEVLPPSNVVDENFGGAQTRASLVCVLMAIASEAFMNMTVNLDGNSLPEQTKRMLSLVAGTSQDRARFRKWAFSSNDLLKIAEGIHSLSDAGDYRHYKSKLDFADTK